MKCAMTVNEPLHHLTSDNRIVCGKELAGFATVNVAGIMPVCSDCEAKLRRAYAEYGTIMKWVQKAGQPCKILGYAVGRRITSRSGDYYYKSTGTFYRSTDPRQHPNDFEQACEEIERIAASLP